MIHNTHQNITAKIKLIPLLITAFFLLLPALLSAELLDRVVAVVNDDIITLSEVDETGAEYLNKIRRNIPAGSQEQALMKGREKVLDKLIDQRLINQAAKEANISLSDKEFQAAYDKNLQGLKLTKEQLLQKLKKSGLSEENFLENLRNQLLRDKLVLYEVRSKIIVTEEMMKKYYDTEYAKKIKGGDYYLLQMGFTWGDSPELEKSAELAKADKAQAYKRAEEARKEVIDGADFRTVAKEKSELSSAADGGDLGIFQADEMVQYMRKAVLPLKAGEISPILETPIGYQFFKLLSSQEGEIVHLVPFESVQDEIQKNLFDEKFKKEFKKWVTKMKDDAYVKKMLF